MTKVNIKVFSSQRSATYMDLLTASKAAEAGKKSFTATSLFSFFLSKSFMKENNNNIHFTCCTEKDQRIS